MFSTRTFTNPPRWKDFKFSVIDTVNAGSFIWFGAYAEGFITNFDFGGTYYKNWPDQVEVDDEVYDLPDFPINSSLRTFNYILSWYFNYETQKKDYIRVLTQGVNLTDSRKSASEYRRGVIQTVKISTATDSLKAFCRKLQEMVQANPVINGLRIFYRTIKDTSHGIDGCYSQVVFMRTMQDDVKAADLFGFLRGFYRGIFDTVETDCGVKLGWTFLVKVSDTAGAVGSVFRGLVFFVRIMTGLFVRDYVLSRFLKAKSEVNLKSCVSREIVLESKIK
jgi:hypothetical protein